MKSIQIFALFLLASLSSCQKDPIEATALPVTSGAFIPAPQAPTKRLSERINFAANDYVSLQYNSAGQVVRMEEEDGVYTFTYTGSTVHIVDSSTVQNRIVWDFTGQLNADGFLVSGNAISSRVGAPVPVTYTFTYNKLGYLIQRNMDQNNGQNVYVMNYTQKDGNLIRLDVTRNGAYNYGGIYGYGTTQDKLKLNWDRFDVINNFTGMSNRNLPTKYIGLDNTGNKSWDKTMTYSLDSDGFPVKVEEVFSNGNVWEFEYFY